MIYLWYRTYLRNFPLIREDLFLNGGVDDVTERACDFVNADFEELGRNCIRSGRAVVAKGKDGFSDVGVRYLRKVKRVIAIWKGVDYVVEDIFRFRFRI